MLTMEQGNLWSKTAHAHTQWKNNLLLKKIVTLRHLTRTTSSTVQSTRRTLTSTFQEYHTQQWNDHRASTFEIWFRKSRTTLSDMHFKVIFNNIDNSILSAKNHKTWFKQLETLNCVNYSMLNPKHKTKHAWRIGTSASSTARAVTSFGMIRQRTRSTSSQFLTSFRFTTTTSGKVDPMVTATGRRGSRVLHRESAQKEMQEKRFLEHSRSVHPWCKIPRDHNRNWVALKKWFVKWTNWRTRITHTTHATEEEINVYRSNWWIRSNFVGSDTMPVRHRADFKEALSTLRRLKNQEDQAYYQNWWQSSSWSWLNWQDSWWHPSSETSPRRWTQPWSIRETCENSNWANYSWNDAQN